MKHFVGLISIVAALLFTQTSFSAQDFCVSSNIQRELFDTINSYIIKGHIKDPACIRTTTFAVANNLKVLNVHTDATIFKFKFAGYSERQPNIPLYYIIMGNGLYLTRENPFIDEITVASFSNQQNQKWVLKKNMNGTYSILGDDGINGTFCAALGSHPNNPSTLNSIVKFTYKYVDGNRYQEFWITKLQ